MKQKGQVVMNMDEIDKKRASIEQPDESKLIFDFKMGNKDPKNEGAYFNTGPVQYRYHRTVDWLDKKSTGSLNEWRNQVR